MAGERDLSGGRGNLLYQLGSKAKPQMWPLVPIVVDYVCQDKIDSELRLAAAVDFLLKQPPGTGKEEVDLAKLDEVAGVGVVISPEQMEVQCRASDGEGAGPAEVGGREGDQGPGGDT